MENPGAYIPLDRRAALVRGETLPDRTTGAALFADISGFTPLTDALVHALGARRGAEELTRQLNEVYDALIAAVDRYAGSVIGFAGDAITCWFDRDSGARAAACGLAMQRAMRAFASVPLPSGDAVALAVKVAVAAGPARRFLVGDPTIQTVDVLAGATLARMAAGEHLAGKGEVVVDDVAAAHLGRDVGIAGWRTDEATGRRFATVEALAEPGDGPPAPDAPMKGLSDAQVRPWLLPPIYGRLAAGQGEFLAELRPAVALFLSFGGIDYDGDDAAGARLDAYVRRVQHVLARYGGYLLQVIVGDKGSYLYAAFGAPIAHDDDAERAVAAAFALCPPPVADVRQRPESDPGIAPVQVGIAAGRVFTGAYGGTTRRTYGVLGDTVNLAARLMQHAPAGGVLATARIYKATAHSYHWQSLPPLRVKGKEQAVEVFQLSAATGHAATNGQEPRYALPMVGRESELALVADRLDRVLSGHGQIVAITADAGMGKSRLVAESSRLASERGLRVYSGECQSYGVNDSYHVWEGIWRAFFRLDIAETLDEQIRLLESYVAAIDGALVPRVPLLGVALNLPIPDNDLTRSLDARLRKDSLEAFLVDCLRGRARTEPIVLVLEDCHWLDPLSHDLLEAIGRAASDLPILIIVAYRPPEVERLQAPRIVELPICTRIALSSFTPQEAERLIELKLAQLLGTSVPPPVGLVERMTDRAQGNPFYIEELLNYLHDRGLDPADQRALQQLELPTSLHSLILSRIDQLSESQKISIKVASVVGRQFRMAWLWGVHPQLGAPERVRADLDTLDRLDLTPLDQAEPERIYLFKHIVTREAAYESLPYTTRALLHGQLGQFIEQTYAAEIDQYVDLLAHHYDQSRIESKKREYLHRAGEAAQAAYANESAVDYYRRLLPLVSGADRVVIMLALGQVLELMGDWAEAGDLYGRALDLATKLEDQPGQAAGQRALGRLRRKQGEYHEAAAWLAQARGAFEHLGDLASVSQVMTDLGDVARQLGAYAEARTSYETGLALAAAAPDRDQRLRAQAQALKGAGTLASQQGDSSTARALYEQSLAICKDVGDRPGVAVLLNNLGVVIRHQGDYAGARAMTEQSLAVFREVGDRWSMGQLLNNLGCVAADMGDYGTARQLLGESLEIRRQLGDKSGLALSLNSLGDVLLDEGDRVAARRVLEDSLHINWQVGDRAAAAYLLDDFAALAALEGEPEQALRLAGAAAAAHEATGAALSEAERDRFDRFLQPARLALGEQRAAEIWHDGHALTLDVAVGHILAESSAASADAAGDVAALSPVGG